LGQHSARGTGDRAAAGSVITTARSPPGGPVRSQGLPFRHIGPERSVM